VLHVLGPYQQNRYVITEFLQHIEVRSRLISSPSVQFPACDSTRQKYLAQALPALSAMRQKSRNTSPHICKSPIFLSSHGRSSITTNCDESKPAAVNNYSIWLPVPDIHSGWVRITPLQQYYPPAFPSTVRGIAKTWSWLILMQVRYDERKHRRVNSLAMVTPIMSDITTRMLTGERKPLCGRM
jgi:hypothetical protein